MVRRARVIRLPSLLDWQASDVCLLRNAIHAAPCAIARRIATAWACQSAGVASTSWKSTRYSIRGMPAEWQSNEVRAPAVRCIEVAEEEAGQRIDNYLIARLKGVPKSHIYRILRSGEVRVNSSARRSPHKRGRRRPLRIPPVRVAERDDAAAARRTSELPILFEDDRLLAIDKPAGLAVHGGSGVSFGVIESLRAHAPRRALPGARAPPRPRHLGRAAARQEAQRADGAARAACASATWTSATSRWSRALAQREAARAPVAAQVRARRGRAARRASSDEGQEAETVFHLQSSAARRSSLLEAELLTGRTHQIRVHLAHLGLPDAGRRQVRRFRAQPGACASEGLKRMFLHAASSRFEHPATGAPARRSRRRCPPELAEVRWRTGLKPRGVNAYDLMVFDWDGTLMDSTAVIVAACRSACRDVGLAGADASARAYVIGLGLHDALGARGARRSTRTGARASSERYRHHFLAREHEMPLFDGVLRDARRPARRGRTGSPSPPARPARPRPRARQRPGSRRCFDATRCADEGFAKPHPGHAAHADGHDRRRAAARGDDRRHHARPGAGGQCRRAMRSR